MKPEAWPPAPGGTPFEKLGGAEKIGQLVEHFYDFMERDEPALAALHKMDAPGRISREIRDNFASFLCFWLGGEGNYIEKRGHPRLRSHASRIAMSTTKGAWRARSLGWPRFSM